MRRLLDFDPTTRIGGPWLRCPIPPAIHADVRAAQAGCVEWAIAVGLTTKGSPRHAFLRRSRFGILAGRCFAWASREQLQLAADWITFLFFYDDLCDTLEEGENDDESVLNALDARLVSILRGRLRGPLSDPYCRAVADIRVRLLDLADPGWVARLADDVELYLQGVRWERSVERSGDAMTLATYQHMRPMISAVNTCLDLAGAFVDGSNPRLGREPLVQELERIANNHISWVNDIYSVDREIAHGQTANLVVLLMKSEGLAPRAALDRAIEICNAEMAAFVALESHLDALGSAQADAYASVMSIWIRGSLDWHAESDRYRRSEELSSGTEALEGSSEAA